MIPKNITYENVLFALSEINRTGVPSKRNSTKFHLLYNESFYPPKYVISLANKYANGLELSPNYFSGGIESNSFLLNLGFEILKGHDTLNNKKDKTSTNIIVTAIIESDNKYSNKSQLLLLDEIIEKVDSNIDIIILSGGFIKFSKQETTKISTLVSQITEMLNKADKKLVVCFGIDAPLEKNQLGIAITSGGILAPGRKFYPTKGEKGELHISGSAYEKELGYERSFHWKGKKYFIAVCYDSFGINHLELPKQGVDSIIDLIHGFDPKGEGPSGEAYFARHGLAGAAKQWKCPAFGSAVFFNRSLPLGWPSGIFWNKGKLSTQYFKYEDNPLKPFKIQEIPDKHEKVIMRYFEVKTLN